MIYNLSYSKIEKRLHQSKNLCTSNSFSIIFINLGYNIMSAPVLDIAMFCIPTSFKVRFAKLLFALNCLFAICLSILPECFLYVYKKTFSFFYECVSYIL